MSTLDEFPIPETGKKPWPLHKAKEQAFYAANLAHNDPKSPFRDETLSPEERFAEAEGTYDTVKTNLTQDGESSTLDEIARNYGTQEDEHSKQILTDYISDSSVHPDAKKAVLSNYKLTKQLPTSLKEIYLRKAATEDHAVTQEDRDTHSMMLDSFHTRLKAASDMELAISDFAATMDSSTVGATASFAGDVAIKSIVPGAMAAQNMYVAQDAFGADTDNKVKDFFLPGSKAKDLGKRWDALNPEQQMEVWKQMLPRLQNMYGTDYSKYDVLTNIVDNPDMATWQVALENVFGVVDATLIGKAITSPKQAIKSFIQTFTPKAGLFSVRSADKAARAVAATSEVEEKLARRAEKMVYTATPKPNPASVMSVLGKVNPQKGSKARIEALMDDTGKLADSMGTSRGEILGEQLPQWTKALDDINPDLAAKIKANDAYFSQSLTDNVLDPNFVNITQRDIDRDILQKALTEVRGAHYMQANSTMMDDLTSIHGTATYGRNAEFGFKSVEDATKAMDELRKVMPTETTASMSVRQVGDQHFINVDYSRNYDPFTEFSMGTQTVNAKIYPVPFSDMAINMDSFARTFAGRAFFNPTSMLDPWIAKAAASASMRSTKVESDFVKVIKDNILSIKHKDELGKELRHVQDGQAWKSYKDLAASNAHLDKAGVDELYEGYVNFRRLTDYQYEWANLADYKIRHAQDQKAIYHPRDGHVGYGSRITEDEASKVKYAWDMESGKPMKIDFDQTGKPILNGKELVRLDNPMNKTLDEVEDIQGGFSRLADDNIFEYGLIGGKMELTSLPQRTLNRIEGYVPRKNVENYYIKKIPKQVRVNGELITDPARLARYARTVAAEWSDSRANQLVERLAKEPGNANYDLRVAVDRLDSTDSIITDYKVHQEMMAHSRKRGERLPTLDGAARLDDPLTTMVDSIRSSVRLGIWGDYTSVFQKNYVKSFGEFLPNREFPNVLTDLVAPTLKDKALIEKFKAAQTLFRQYTNQQYKVTIGDDVWKSIFHGVGDVLEKTGSRILSEGARDVARQGNLITKVPKSIGSALFLHLSPLRQWVVQTQQQLEWAVLMPENAIGRMRSTGAIGMAILAKADYMKGAGSGVHKTAQIASGLNAKEFDAVVEAIHKSGLPQSVDLNMMLHGLVNDVKMSLDSSVGRKAIDIPMNVIKTPASLGKAVGYTPAEFSNTIGTWLFAKDRWTKANPGKDWNTPENIAKISGDAWDLSGSMTTRAGALPYQDGFMSMFFQFAAIQQKMLMQVFSSKTLTKGERGKLIATKAALWGMYGTAMGGVLDQLVAGIDDVEFQAKWNEYKGGLVDLATNKLITEMFVEAGEKPSTLAVSGSMSPMPATHPYIQVVEELGKMLDNDPMSNPRFAFTGAVGGLYQAAKDIKSIFQMMPVDSPDALAMIGREVAESASGWNNYQKAMMIKEWNDKKDKFGNPMGLELSSQDMIAQLFGVITREEQFSYKMTNAKFEESNFVRDRAKEIHDFMKTHRAKYGTEEWNEGLRRFRAINTLTPDHLKERIEDEYLRLDRKMAINAGDSNTQYILNNIRANHGGKMTEMLGYLKSTNTEQAKKVIKELQDSGLIEGAE